MKYSHISYSLYWNILYLYIHFNLTHINDLVINCNWNTFFKVKSSRSKGQIMAKMGWISWITAISHTVSMGISCRYSCCFIVVILISWWMSVAERSFSRSKGQGQKVKFGENSAKYHKLSPYPKQFWWESPLFTHTVPS